MENPITKLNVAIHLLIYCACTEQETSFTQVDRVFERDTVLHT